MAKCSWCVGEIDETTGRCKGCGKTPEESATQVNELKKAVADQTVAVDEFVRLVESAEQGESD